MRDVDLLAEDLLDEEVLMTEIEKTRERLADLRQRTEVPYSANEDLMQTALQEIHTTLEELQVAEEELRRQKNELLRTRINVEAERQRYYDLFEMAPDGHLVTDANGVIREANRAATILFNLPPKFIVGKPLANFVADEERSLFRTELNSVFQMNLRSELEVNLHPRAAQAFDAVLTVCPCIDHATGEKSLHWIVRDISERKRTGRRLLALNAELEQRVQDRTVALEAAYDREHHIAETLQRSLLGEISEDAFPNLKVITFYEAALSEALVGGDFYGALPFGNGQAAFIVGDVSGKGLEAAAYTSQVRCVLHAFLGEGMSPAEAMTGLNDFVYLAQSQGDWQRDIFVALSLVVVDPRTGEVMYYNAGLEPPILLHADGSLESINVRGSILGVYPGAEYQPACGHLAPGDTVLLFTDGLTEARCQREFLGYDGLMEIVQQSSPINSLRLMSNAIMNSARSYAGGSLQDDACLLLVKWLPSSSTPGTYS